MSPVLSVSVLKIYINSHTRDCSSRLSDRPRCWQRNFQPTPEDNAVCNMPMEIQCIGGSMKMCFINLLYVHLSDYNMQSFECCVFVTAVRPGVRQADRQ